MKKLLSLLLIVCLALPTIGLAEDYPKIKFHQKNYIASTDDTARVKVTVSKAGSMKTPITLELRNAQGEVLATKDYKAGTKELTFSFQPDESQEGGHDLSVWYGDVKLNTEESYLAITDRHRKVITKIETDQPLMCITIDCAFVGGPTDQFLEILDKYNVKCTFFMTGQFVEHFPEQAKKIRDAGHEIGNHSYSHPHMVQLDNLDKWAYQVRHTVDIIRETLGVNPRLFRPPFGEFNWKISSFARSEGMEVCMWTVDSHDWDPKFARAPENVIKRITETKGPSMIDKGVIILFHLDGYNTASILDQMIPRYQEMGYTLVPVTTLLEAGGRALPALPHGIEE